jgi:putrescine transport system substrate-binding protein
MRACRWARPADIIFPGRQSCGIVVQGSTRSTVEADCLGNIDPFLEILQVADPGNKYTVPYMFWTNGFVYDAKKIKAIDPNAPVDSWAMMFDPAMISKFSSCGVSILDSPEDVIDLAQNYLHLHPGKTDPAEIKQAADLVAKLQPHIAQFDSTGTIGALADGSRCLAMTWSGDYSQAANRAKEAGSDVELLFGAKKREHRHDTMAILKDTECRRGA